MKITQQRALEAQGRVEIKVQLAQQRDDAFWKERGLARAADQEKTARLRKLRLAKEVADRSGGP